MRAAPMLLPIIPMIVVLAGCSSSFVGQKIGLTPDTQAPIVKTGIPITMNRPEFQLTVKKEKVGNTGTIDFNYCPELGAGQCASLHTKPGSRILHDVVLQTHV